MARTTGFGRPHRQPFLARTMTAVRDSARDRAQQARDELVMRLKGHHHRCPKCGDTQRTDRSRDRHKYQHVRAKQAARGKGRGQAAPRVPFKGREIFTVNGKRVRNGLEFGDVSRQHAERAKGAEDRRQQRATRQAAVNGRAARGGRPAGAPNTRTPRAPDTRTRAERAAEWKAHRMQHAAGRVTREGVRIPGTGTTGRAARVVTPKVRVAPNVR